MTELEQKLLHRYKCRDLRPAYFSLDPNNAGEAQSLHHARYGRLL
jgi:hypothetical protein